MINDQIVALDQAMISAHDRGLFFGDGVYEVVRSYGGHIWAFEAHLGRLERSMRELRITGLPVATIKQRVLKALDEANLPDAKAYFHVTRGLQQRAHPFDSTLQPQFLLTVAPMVDDAERRARGCNAITYPDIRWRRCDIKSLNLLANVMARTAAKEAGAVEALFVRDDGIVTEGAAASIFVVNDGAVHTTPLSENILPGITRIAILQAAHDLKIPVVERSLPLKSVFSAEEVFMAGTGEELLGLIQLDGQSIGNGTVGSVCTRLYERLTDFIAAKLELTWTDPPGR